MKLATSPKRWAARIGLAALGLCAIAGTYAFRVLFSRPGEAALSLVPDDALVVASIDLKPSPAQALTFKDIDDALKRNGLKQPIEKSLFDLVDSSKAAEPIKELTTRSFSGCVLPSHEKKDDTGFVGFFPLTDGAAADKALHQKGRLEFWRGTQYYRLPHSRVGMFVNGENLIVSDQPWALHQIAEVATGGRPRLTDTEAYQKARADSPSDANLLVMFSPKLQDFGKKAGVGELTTDWVGLSLRIEAGGLSFLAVGKMDTTKDEAFKAIAGSTPLRKDLLKVLPPDAYGFVADAQANRIYDAAAASLKGGDHRKFVDDSERDLYKETGISVREDVLPAFKGDAVVGIYPSASPAAGVDLLVLVDNQNGANPEELASKLQAYVDKQARKSDGPGGDWLTKVDRSDVTEYRLSDKVQKEMRKSMDFGHGAIRNDVMVGKKTVAWAKVDGAVLIATSQDLLDKAVASYEGKGPSLAGDPSLAQMSDPSDGCSLVLALSPTRIADGVKNSVDESKMDGQGKKMLRNFISALADLKSPLVFKHGMTPDGKETMKLFIPIDYAKTIDLVGQAFNGNSAVNDTGS